MVLAAVGVEAGPQQKREGWGWRDWDVPARPNCESGTPPRGRWARTWSQALGRPESAPETVPLRPWPSPPVLAAGCRVYSNKFVVWKGSSQSSITHGESSLSSHHTLAAAPFAERVLEAGQGSAPAPQILP